MVVQAPTYIVPDDVAEHLGLPLPADDRLVRACTAAEGWINRRRFRTDPAALWLNEDVVQGGILYASLLYQQRAQPQGFPGMDSLGNLGEDTGMAMAQIYRLVGGPDPSVA